MRRLPGSFHHDGPDDIVRITHQNALRWYSFDPFAHVPRERATVGALRHGAAGHDVSIRAMSKRNVHDPGTTARFVSGAFATQS